MKNPLPILWEAGSVIAGLLVGTSIVVPVLAMTIADPDGWQLFRVFGALFILALGLTLQVVVTAKPRRRHASSTETGALPAGLMELSHQR
jgi:hypothetical protein